MRHASHATDGRNRHKGKESPPPLPAHQDSRFLSRGVKEPLSEIPLGTWDPERNGWIMRLRMIRVARRLEQELENELDSQAVEWQLERWRRILLELQGGGVGGEEGAAASVWALTPLPSASASDANRARTETIAKAFLEAFEGLRSKKRKLLAAYLIECDEREEMELESDTTADEEELVLVPSATDEENGRKRRLLRDSESAAFNYFHPVDIQTEFQECTWRTVLDEPDSALYFTPLRNGMQLHILGLEGKLGKHPWARFVDWFLAQTEFFAATTTTEEEYAEDILKSLYSNDQTITRSGARSAYMIAFVFPAHDFAVARHTTELAPLVVFISRVAEQAPTTSEFRIYGNLYGDSQAGSSAEEESLIMTPKEIKAELKRLKQTVVEHEKGMRGGP
jgi:hypothetical protein